MAHWYLAPWVWDTAGPPHWRAPTGAVAALDLRPEAAQAAAGGTPQGFGLFGFPTTQSISGATYYGDDLLGNMNVSRRNAWRNALGIVATLTNTRLDLVIAETLGDKSDPASGTRARPIRPNQAGRLELYLGTAGNIFDREFEGAGDAFWPRIQTVEQASYRQIRSRCLLFAAALNNATEGDGSGADRLIRWFRLKHGVSYETARQALVAIYAAKYKRFLGALRRKYLRFGLAHIDFIPSDLTDEGWLEPETTITESFNQSDSTTVGPDLTWTEVAGTWDTTSNMVRINGFSDHAGLRAESDLSSDDHYSQITRKDVGSFLADPAVRFSASANTFYTFFHFTDAARQLRKVVSGTPTSLTSSAGALAVDDVMKVSADGSSLKGYVNGVEADSVTDTSITGNLRTGLYGFGTCRADDFEAADLGGGGATGIVRQMIQNGLFCGGAA